MRVEQYCRLGYNKASAIRGSFVAVATKSGKKVRQSLTLQQQRFANEYITNGGGAKAATIVAGYSERSASQIATKLLGTTSICAYIGERRQALEERTGITQERVLQELWDIAIADPNELVEHRVVCCRYCWGEGHLYQMTPRDGPSR